ncbi:MAG: hypothetical protein ACOCW3_04160 [Spirochaetota bacterium]
MRNTHTLLSAAGELAGELVRLILEVLRRLDAGRTRTTLPDTGATI